MTITPTPVDEPVPAPVSTHRGPFRPGDRVQLTDPKGKMHTIVLEPGREYKEIARNTLETFRSTPVFEGRRMYVRTLKHLWCIGKA